MGKKRRARGCFGDKTKRGDIFFKGVARKGGCRWDGLLTIPKGKLKKKRPLRSEGGTSS